MADTNEVTAILDKIPNEHPVWEVLLRFLERLEKDERYIKKDTCPDFTVSDGKIVDKQGEKV